MNKEITYFRYILRMHGRTSISQYPRGYNETHAGFFKGFMEWYLEDDSTAQRGKKFLVLMPNRAHQNSVTRIVWEEGTRENHGPRPATDAKCVEALAVFVTKHGSWNQWLLNDCSNINAEIWDSLNFAYGMPFLKRGWGPHGPESR
jgi:hypothetical protein